jgi:3-oxoacyl-[acyl-carrier-protein] synthase II
MLDTDARPQVGVTGLGVMSGCGRGPQDLFEAVTAGRPAFRPVTRFDVSRRGSAHAAQLPEVGSLAAELVDVIGEALTQARLVEAAEPGSEPSRIPVLLALHSDLNIGDITAQVAEGITHRFGVLAPSRVYTGACVASSTALADAAAHIRAGRHERVVVAAGYLVEPDTFAVFDAGRALSRDAAARPFSKGRNGLLLGDAVAAVVLEAMPAAERRAAKPLARLVSWGSAGDAHHVCRPRPDGAGLARAIGAALQRVGARLDEIAYVNANATGSQLADPAEVAALRLVFGDSVEQLPVSSTKSVHGHALEASALLEFVVTVLALGAGRLPVNAGYLDQDADCRLDLVLGEARTARPGYALSLNCAFGGANTALLVGAA